MGIITLISAVKNNFFIIIGVCELYLIDDLSVKCHMGRTVMEKN